MNASKILLISLRILVVMALCGCSSAEDEREARAIVDRVHEQIRDGNYSTIYNEAALGFKSSVPEDKFVEAMRQHRTKAGPLRKAVTVAYETGVNSTAGKVQVSVNELEFENGRVKERLTLTRSESGKMQLWLLEWSPVQ